MPTVAVLGATGYTGRLVARMLVDRGHEVVLLGRDAARLDRLAGNVGDGVRGTRVLEAAAVDGDLDALAAAIDGADAVASTIGGDPEQVRAVRTAAVRAGVPAVDTAADLDGLRWTVDALDDEARAAGVALVPAVGWRTATGDLLAAVTGARLDAPREVHVAYVVPDRGGIAAASSTGERRAFAATLAAPTGALVGGEVTDERPGEVRRLAWFPRPVGPHHAAGIGGTEPATVPRHLVGVRTVRTYLATSSLRAELLQAAANLSRRPRGRRWVAGAVGRGAPGGGPAHDARTAARWACVVEVASDDGLARGWANGRDPHRTTARMVAVALEAALADGAPAGVLPPAAVAAPGDLLDALAAGSELRWTSSTITADP